MFLLNLMYGLKESFEYSFFNWTPLWSSQEFFQVWLIFGVCPKYRFLLNGLFCIIFKASALWADAFYKSKCPSVCVFVRLSFCLCVCSLLRYRLTVFLPPLPEFGCPIFLEIRNPWGKVMKRSGLRYEHFCLIIV